MAADYPPQRADGPLDRLSSLHERGKEPASKSILNAWVNQAQPYIGLDTGRLGWLIASTVIVAVLQRAIDKDGRSRFLLKGGTYLQHRLSWTGRPTKDVDGMVRGDIEEFLAVVDDALRLPWGPLTLTRDPVEVINTPGKIVKPRRFDVLVSLKGQVWRRIQVEVSPDEAGASDGQDILTAPGLHYFGLPSPDRLVGIAMRFQIAQKIHACTDPHEPPELRNDRARDAVDLLLLRDLVATEQTPTLAELRQACVALFAARAAEARALGRPDRPWPPTAVALDHWSTDYATAATLGGITLPLKVAIAELNVWILAIDSAATTASDPQPEPAP